MTEIYARATPVIEPALTGVHLSWVGPGGFLFAPGGWRIERRKSGARRTPDECEAFGRGDLKGLDEFRLAIGVVTAKTGLWPGPEGGACEIWMIDLDAPAAGLYGRVVGPQAYVFGLRGGKAAAFAGPLSGNFDLGPAPVDTLLFYLRLQFTADATLRLCRRRVEVDDWSDSDLLTTLQLPIAELMPLAGPGAEFAEAKRRLLPGEAIDPRRFADIADMLRPLAKSPPGRPIERTLLARSDAEDDFDEMSLVDPLRMLFSSPTWRRALGFSFCDRDPALVPGDSYDYRLTGLFPADAARPFYGFHTVPSGTGVPAQFQLHDCHFRLAAPTSVERAPGTARDGLLTTTRRGIAVAPRSGGGWVDTLIAHHSLVVDLPAPATKIALELEPGHAFKVAGGDPWGPFGAETAVPAGPDPVLSFAQPISQLRLTGAGFLFAVRPLVDTPGAIVPIVAVLSGTRLVDTPRPPPPLAVTATNLQTVAQLTTANDSRPPPRNLLGIHLRWQPAPAAELAAWPTQAGAPPPLDATMFQAERRIEPAGAWQPLLGGDNLLLGDRADGESDRTVRPGIDLMELYPEEAPPGGGTRFAYRDVFLGESTEEAGVRRTPQPPPPGTMLRYRMRTVDLVGRPSAGWTESDPVRLEKHEPPPLPAAADDRPADQLDEAAATGVTARVLVRGAPSMSAEDAALLGDSDNVIVLRWGWHAKQRRLDPHATQFRLYLGPALDEVPGAIVSATPVTGRPGMFSVTLTLDRPVVPDAAKGLYLDAGYPFFIDGHGGGAAIVATVRTMVAAAGGGFRTPASGPIRLPLRASPRLTRSSGWRERVRPTPDTAFVPITAAETYQAVIRDRLVLSEDHPRDTMWVGVTAADSEAYVADGFTGVAPGGPLAGNESAVAAAICDGRRMVRPLLQPTLPAGPVPRIVTPEPAGATVRLRLDLAPYLAGVGGPLQILRLHASDLFATLEAESGAVVARPPEPRAGDTTRPIAIPNAADRAAVADGIAAGAFDGIDDRFLVLLAQLHPWPDRLFQSARNDPVPSAAFDETLPGAPARYVYAVRAANSAGLLSEEIAVAHVVLRVPSPLPGAQPAPDSRRPGDPTASLAFRVPPDPRVTHLLLFRVALTEANVAARGVLLRVPNRPDLYPAGGIRLRLDGGETIAPQVLEVADLESDGQGRRLLVGPDGPQQGPVRVWLATLTGDGIPSPPSGPWTIPYRLPPLIAPQLAGAMTPRGPRLDWSWPGDADSMATVERSTDGAAWERISPPLRPPLASFDCPPTQETHHYRLQLRTAGGRAAFSNVVTV
jgi:hypothetical protein